MWGSFFIRDMGSYYYEEKGEFNMKNFIALAAASIAGYLIGHYRMKYIAGIAITALASDIANER